MRSAAVPAGSKDAEQPPGGVAIAVVHTDRDQADAGVESLVQLRTLVGRPVVGYLDYVHRPWVGHAQHGVLRLFAEVAEEQGTDAPAVEPDRHAARIPDLHHRPSPYRPEDVPSQRPEGAVIARVCQPHAGAARREAVVQALVLGVFRVADQGGVDHPDDRVDPSDMVHVVVGEHRAGRSG